MNEWLGYLIALLVAVRALTWLGRELRGWGRPLRVRWTLPGERPLVVAHRGGWGLAPENTLAAFRGAAGLGCGFLELDVRASRDGVPVVIHDATVDRVTDGSGPVHEKTLAELKALAVQSPGAGPVAPADEAGRRIPTLEEVLRAVPEAVFSVDVKQEQPRCEAAVVEVIRRCGMTRRVLLGSADHRRFLRLRRLAPETPSFFSRRSVTVFYAFVRLGLWRWYRPPHHTLQIPERVYRRVRLATPAVIRAARRLDIPVLVWVINEEARMQRLLNLGVDGIVTAYPDRLQRLIARRREGAAAEAPRPEAAGHARPAG